MAASLVTLADTSGRGARSLTTSGNSDILTKAVYKFALGEENF
ncbi:MAG: hypothetical protein AB4042_07915 [Leptolyngbyaceae cyanobacterium]